MPPSEPAPGGADEVEINGGVFLRSCARLDRYPSDLHTAARASRDPPVGAHVLLPERHAARLAAQRCAARKVINVGSFVKGRGL